MGNSFFYVGTEWKYGTVVRYVDTVGGTVWRYGSLERSGRDPTLVCYGPVELPATRSGFNTSKKRSKSKVDLSLLENKIS